MVDKWPDDKNRMENRIKFPIKINNPEIKEKRIHIFAKLFLHFTKRSLTRIEMNKDMICAKGNWIQQKRIKLTLEFLAFPGSP